MFAFHWRKWLAFWSRSQGRAELRTRPEYRTRTLCYPRMGLERLEDRTVLSPTLFSHYTGLDVNAPGDADEPPDDQGAAGKSSYVEAINQSLAIYTPKSTGTTAVSDTLADFYFTQGGLANGGSSFGQSDPFVIWDDQVNRFIVGDIDYDTSNTNGGTNALLVAVSKTDSPTTLTKSDWYFSEFNTTESTVALQDYPGDPGYNHDALVVTFNSFDQNGNIAHNLILAMSIQALINGTAPSLNSNYYLDDYTTNGPGGTLDLIRPTTMHDSKAGDPMWFTQAGDLSGGSSIDVVKMSNVLSTSPTFNATSLPVNPYSVAVPELQPNGSQITTATDSRMMKAAEMNGLLVTSDIVSDSAGDLDNARWYEINVGGGTPTLVQQGDVSGGPGVYNAYPSVDINTSGDIGMVYMSSGTGAGQYLSTYVTGRTPTDPIGTMETPVLVQAGTSNYGGSREGDMTNVNIDTDGSFWGTGEWANNEGSVNWGTDIGHFGFGSPFAFTPFGATEGFAANNVTVATFTDASGASLSSYVTTIDWGDGSSPDSGTVTKIGPSTFAVTGSHTYEEEGNYVVSVNITSGKTDLGTATGVEVVNDASLTGIGTSLSATAGTFLTNARVATFTDTDPNPEGPGNYTATIYWYQNGGTAGVSSGRIVSAGNNVFAVFGDNPYTYATGGTFLVNVVIADVGGATVTVGSTATVGHNPGPPHQQIYSADGTPSNNNYTSLQDALNNLIQAEYFFIYAILGPDGNIAIGNLINALMQYELAVLQYDMTLNV